MSAITGIFYRDGRKVDPELIKKMNNRLSHRGPDGSAVWCGGSVALGHQMLWTTPESLHEKLPFEESGLVITADARIDNRKELSDELDIEDKETVSDSYFILKAYEKWGENCPDKLLGDFAFAIWDKNEEILFCARDHMGVKPFYYYLDDETFVFGTEIKALFCVPGVPRKLNELKVAMYLTGMIAERELTFYEDILRLPAANSIIIEEQKIKKDRYWELDPDLKVKMDSDEEYYQRFFDIFSESVNCRLRSSFPVGFELSGGLDSSSIVCTAKKIYEKNYKDVTINTFSKIFTDIPECDESYYIQKVIDLGGIEPYFLRADKIGPLDKIDKILWYHDEPFYIPNLPSIWELYKKIQNSGNRVFLSGHDGDSTISHGTNFLKDLALSFRWNKLIKEINGLSKDINQLSSRVFLNKVLFPLITKNFKNWSFKKNKRRPGEYIFNNKQLVERLNLESYSKKYYRFHSEEKTARKSHYSLITHGSHQYTLEVLDRNVSAFNIEPRYPFFDKRLIDFCYAIPTEQKFCNGKSRNILRQAMADILPFEIQQRVGKINFAPVFEKNFLLFEKERLDMFIYENNNEWSEFIDLEHFKNAYERYKSKSKYYHIYDSVDMEKLIILNLWLEQINIILG